MDKAININWKTVDNLLGYEQFYNEDTDILIIQSNENRPAISVDCNGEYWMRVDPETGEILGVEIEAFKKVFLKRHKDMLKTNNAYVRPIADLIEREQCETPRLATA